MAGARFKFDKTKIQFPDKQPGGLLTQKDIEKLLDVSAMTVYLWRKATDPFPCRTIPTSGGSHHVFFPQDEVLAWLQRNRPAHYNKKMASIVSTPRVAPVVAAAPPPTIIVTSAHKGMRVRYRWESDGSIHTGILQSVGPKWATLTNDKSRGKDYVRPVNVLEFVEDEPAPAPAKK